MYLHIYICHLWSNRKKRNEQGHQKLLNLKQGPQPSHEKFSDSSAVNFINFCRTQATGNHLFASRHVFRHCSSFHRNEIQQRLGRPAAATDAVSNCPRWWRRLLRLKPHANDFSNLLQGQSVATLLWPRSCANCIEPMPTGPVVTAQNIVGVLEKLRRDMSYALVLCFDHFQFFAISSTLAFFTSGRNMEQAILNSCVPATLSMFWCFLNLFHQDILSFFHIGGVHGCSDPLFSLLFRPVYFFLCSKTLPLRARPPKRGGFRPVCLLTCPFFFSKSRRSDAPGKGHDFHLFLCVHVCIETIFYKKQIMIGTICQHRNIWHSKHNANRCQVPKLWGSHLDNEALKRNTT